MATIRITLLLIFITSSLCDTINDSNLNNGVMPANEVQLIEPQTGIITWNRYTISATVLAATFVVIGVYSLITIFMPLITYKLCYIFGYCSSGLPNYIEEYLQTQGHPRQKRSSDYLNLLSDTLLKAYEKYGDVLRPSEEEMRDKRQADYVGPLLQTLAVAYEKYQDGNPKKNFKTGTSYTK